MEVNKYIDEEQPDTQFDLSKKIHSQHMNPTNSIVVHIDCQKLNQQSFQIITQLSEILSDSGEIGEFNLDIFSVQVKNLNTYEKELIVCES